MLRQLFNKLGTTVYIQIWKNRLKLTDSSTGKVFDEKPLVALETDNKGKVIVVAVGNSATSITGKNIKVRNPFSHPRSLLSDFIVGEKLLQYALKDILGNKLLTPAPAIVIHPMEKTEGGLTTIEVRAFRELAFGAGARDSVIYEGRALSAHEIDFKSIKERVGEQ